MINLSVTNIINSLHYFDRDFWLAYKTLESILPVEKFEEIKMNLLKSKKVSPQILQLVNVDLYQQKMADIDAEWRQKNEESKALGTQIHDMIHNELVTDLEGARVKYSIQGDVQTDDTFMNCTSGLFPEHRMEWNLDEDCVLIGVADLISIHDGIVDIMDWKSNEDGIKFKSKFDLAKKHVRKLKYPLSNIDDVNGQHYTLQLSIYLWMLLHLRPDLKPGKLKIVWIRDQKVKKVYEVPYMEKEVERLLPWYVKAYKLKCATDKCKEIRY